MWGFSATPCTNIYINILKESRRKSKDKKKLLPTVEWWIKKYNNKKEVIYCSLHFRAQSKTKHSNWLKKGVKKITKRVWTVHLDSVAILSTHKEKAALI